MIALSVLDLSPSAPARPARRRAGAHPSARRARRRARLPPLLGGRAPQHAGRRVDQPAGADRAASPARTERIRVGSGGVMLPNHAPLVVAEQFALLEASHPGRIDLGIGRAPGSDPVTSCGAAPRAGPTTRRRALPRARARHRGADRRPAARRSRSRRPRPTRSRATPHAAGAPEVWLLGSSDYSAQLAGGQGSAVRVRPPLLRRGPRAALELYRSQYQPSEAHPEPRTFLTVNAVAAPTAEEAEAPALPQLRAMARLRPAARRRRSRPSSRRRQPRRIP